MHLCRVLVLLKELTLTSKIEETTTKKPEKKRLNTNRKFHLISFHRSDASIFVMSSFSFILCVAQSHQFMNRESSIKMKKIRKNIFNVFKRMYRRY